MMELAAGLIDVFADEPLSGNPLAVVQGGDGLSDAVMRRVAGEFNQAETTFILSSARADRKLRSFTASGAEVVGAGHNALGAWLWLAELGELGALDTAKMFHQEIGGDVLPIEIATIAGRAHGRMRQAPLQLWDPLSDLLPLAEALGLEAPDLFPGARAQPAGTGAAHLLVRLSGRAAVDRARADADKLLAILEPTAAEGCYIYAFDEKTPDTAYARFFNPTVGLWEDAATGTAAGPLAAYLGRGRYLKGNALTIEQGTKMGRRSLLHVRLTPHAELSGAGVIVMRGTLRL